MKQTITSAVALAAVLGLAEANQTIRSSYSRKRVREVRTHLEKTYGKGLVGLFDDEGNFVQSRLKAARKRPAATWVSIGGMQIDAENSSSWFYGLSQGLQYKGMASESKGAGGDEANNCFFALYGITDSIDSLLFDATHIFSTSGSVNWFNAVGYNPIQTVGNLSVVYEYCGGYQYLDQLTSIGSLDYGFMAERLSRDATFMFTNWGDMMKQKAASSQQEMKEKAPKKKSYAADADGDDDTVTSLQWDMSDVDEKGATISSMIPKDNYKVGQIWGEVLGQMLGTTLSPET